MPPLKPGRANRILGYPADARLLILNADDFGMCHSVNAAVMRAFQAGVLRSASLMPPCPWALHGAHFLAGHPEHAFGVHMTAISEWPNYRWRPLTPPEAVPSLVDQDGYFYRFERMQEFFAQLRLDQLEREFRAQIEFVLTAGLKPSHLDWHCLRVGRRPDLVELMVRLAQAYGLALRVMGRDQIATLQARGLPTNDFDFLDSYGLDPVHKARKYARLLRELPAGLSEWALHPALDSDELLAIEPDGQHNRQADFDFLVSAQASEIIRAEGIILLDYRALQPFCAGR